MSERCTVTVQLQLNFQKIHEGTLNMALSFICVFV